MPTSRALRDFRSLWGDSCRSMWIELFALRCAGTYLVSRFDLPQLTQRLETLVYAPESAGRLKTITGREYLDELPQYLGGTVTDRVVLLSAGFESYFRVFVETYLRKRHKYSDAGTGELTTAGGRVMGAIFSTRGLSERVTKFSLETNARIKSIATKLDYLSDVYILRNVIAHRAGIIDVPTAGRLRKINIASAGRITLTADELLFLAAPVMEVAEFLDAKIS